MFIGIIVAIIGITIVISACSTSTVEKKIYVTVTDSTTIDSLIYYREQLKYTQDSLNAVKDTTAEDLFVARYKLGRIKYYVDIAKNGNNLKFLRGWCLRVLNGN